MTRSALVLLPLCVFAGLARGQDGAEGAVKLKLAATVRHPSSVTGLVVTPDSEEVIVGLDDGKVGVYSVATRKPLPRQFQAAGRINDMALSAKGDRLALVTGERAVVVLDVATLKPVAARPPFEVVPVCVAYCHAGNTFIVAFLDGSILKLRDSDLSNVDWSSVKPDGSYVVAMACAGDGSVATSHHFPGTDDKAKKGREGIVKVWSPALELKKELWDFNADTVTALAFDPSGRHLVTGGFDGAVKVWRAPDYSKVAEDKTQHTKAIRCIAFTRDNRTVTGGMDGLWKFWEGTTLKPGATGRNYSDFFTRCACTPDGRWLVAGGSSLGFMPLDRPEEFERVTEYGGAVLAVAVSADKKRLVTAGLDGRLLHWDVAKGLKSTLIDRDQDRDRDWFTAAEFCEGGRFVAAGSTEGTVHTFADDTMGQLASWKAHDAWKAHDGRVVALAAAGDKVVSVGDDGFARVWDKRGKRLATYDLKAPCRSVAAHGDQVAVGTADGVVSVYDVANDKQVVRMQGRPLTITALGFASGGKGLVVGYFDGALESVDTTSWRVTAFRPGQGSSVLSVHANPSNQVAAGFRDGFVRVYAAPDLKEIAATQGLSGSEYYVIRRALGDVPRAAIGETFAVRWVLDGSTLAASGGSNEVAFYKLVAEVPVPCPVVVCQPVCPCPCVVTCQRRCPIFLGRLRCRR